MLTLRLLGVPQVTWAGKPLTIPRRAVRALLYYLATPDRSITRAELVRMFWGDFPDEVARPRLRRMLSQLRQALILSGAPAEILQTTEDSVLLRPGAWWADVVAFDSDLSAARSASSPIAAIIPADR